jgi:hypothetical protein
MLEGMVGTARRGREVARKARTPSLELIMEIVSAIVCVTVVVGCGALLWSTNTLRRINSETYTNLQSVRAADEVKLSLLRLSLVRDTRSDDPVVEQQIESDMPGRLAEAERYATTEEERRLVRETAAYVEDYLGQTHLSDPSPEASRSVQRAFATVDARR